MKITRKILLLLLLCSSAFLWAQEQKELTLLQLQEKLSFYTANSLEGKTPFTHQLEVRLDQYAALLNHMHKYTVQNSPHSYPELPPYLFARYFFFKRPYSNQKISEIKGAENPILENWLKDFSLLAAALEKVYKNNYLKYHVNPEENQREIDNALKYREGFQYKDPLSHDDFYVDFLYPFFLNDFLLTENKELVIKSTMKDAFYQLYEKENYQEKIKEDLLLLGEQYYERYLKTVNLKIKEDKFEEKSIHLETMFVLATSYFSQKIKEIDEFTLDKEKLEQVVINPHQVIYMSSPLIFCKYSSVNHAIFNYLQWNALRRIIEATGTKVVVFSEGLDEHNAREKWTRDLSPVFYDDNTAVILWSLQEYKSSPGAKVKIFHYETRKEASRIFKNNFADQVKHLEVAEGNIDGGDALFFPATETLFVSTTYDDESSSFEKHYQKALKEEGYENINIVKVQKSHDIVYKDFFYHLDTFMARLGDKIILYPQAMTPDSLERIKDVVGEENIYVMNDQEALALTSNYVQIGNMILIPYLPPEERHGLYRWIEAQGYLLYPFKGVDSGEGGPHCSTFDLGELPDARNYCFEASERQALQNLQIDLSSLEGRAFYFKVKRFFSSFGEKNLKSNPTLWNEFKKLRQKK